MSGRRQHFIPRFLQAGFASRRDGEEGFTWVYRKDRPPFESNTRNVGVEGQFYTAGADTEADDAITVAEGDYSSLLSSLRDSAPRAVTDPEVSKLIAHFEVRTRHIRQMFIGAADYMVAGMIAFLSDIDVAASYFERKSKSDPALFINPLSEQLRLPKDHVEALVALAAPELFKQWLPVLAELLRQNARQHLNAAAKSAHLRALKQSIAPVPKTERFRELEYATVEVPDADMILGDSIVLFEVAGSRRHKTFLEGADVLNGVYVPLSKRVVLVGAPSRIGSVPSDLPEAIAGSSFEYFISDRNSSQNQSRQTRLGENAVLLSNNEMDAIITEVLTE
jgi:hypothetical protein